MKYLLSRANIRLLDELAARRTLLAFDFDGTLAPIVSARTRAGMRPRTQRLFGQLCELYPCAVISGRSWKDVRRRAPDARVKYFVGNHGLEPGRNLERFARVTRRMTPLLARALTPERGVEIEDKRYSLAVHYRKAQHKKRARAAIEAAVRALPEPMRIIGGKLVVNVVPAGAPHKGDALLQLRKKARAELTLFVGDDVTDEDAFAMDLPGLVGVRVGRTQRSAAAYYLREQREIDRLLLALHALRA
jgi:trehalose 6-phosphate phosphatase